MTTAVEPRRAPRAGAPMEPRLQARRREVAREVGRRRLRRLVVVGSVAAAAVAAVLVVQSPLVDVDRVTLIGATNTGRSPALAATGVEPGTPMVSVDLAGAVERLEALPWVERASVARRWPGTVVVEVAERTPVVVVGRGEAASFVDATGRVLGPAAADTGLPTVAGGGAEVGSTLRGPRVAAVAVVADLPADLHREVAGVRGASSGVVLTLTDDIVVRWGDPTQGGAKAEALRLLLDEADRPSIEGIDVSVPRATTLTRKTGEA